MTSACKGVAFKTINMKILFLTRRAWPEIGGVEKHVLEVSKRLVEMGNEVTIVCEDDEGFIRRCLADQPMSHRLARRTPLGAGMGAAFRTYRIPVGKNEKLKKFWIWGWLWKHRELIKQADIIHIHDVGFWYWPFRFLYPGKPFFVTFHGWEEKFPVPLSNKIQRKISEKMAKGNICVGKYLRKWYGTRADEITYGGIDVPPPGSACAHPGGETTEVRTLFIGRLEKETGIMTYLRALSILNSVKTFKTTILGDGPLRNKIEEYIKENKLNASVLGFVDDPEKYLQKARFIFASGYLSILEAMAAKKLVFSVFENPLKEDYLRLGKLGKFVVICGSENELAEKIKFYLENAEKEKEMTETAYNWVKRETWEKVTETYLRLWKQ